MLPPPIQQAESGSQPLPPEVQQAMQQVQQGQQQLQMAHQQLAQFAQSLQAEKAANESQKAQLEKLKSDIDAADRILQANYQELSAKIELLAMQKLASQPPQTMPPGKDEPALNPNEPASAGSSFPGA
jgi:chromosome segregation ATPase